MYWHSVPDHVAVAPGAGYRAGTFSQAHTSLVSWYLRSCRPTLRTSPAWFYLTLILPNLRSRNVYTLYYTVSSYTLSCAYFCDPRHK